jgi:hypothetical protein
MFQTYEAVTGGFEKLLIEDIKMAYFLMIDIRRAQDR